MFKSLLITIFTFEASLLLKRARPKIVAITGSVGKTSTKDAVYAVLKDSVHARKSEKSYNTELSVPLTILGLRNAHKNPFRWLKNIVDGFLLVIHPGDYPEVLVLEMGVDKPGDMQHLTSWIKPDVVIITSLPDVPVHVENFSSPQAVIAEKLLLLEALKDDGVFVFNHDDPKVKAAADSIRQQSLGFSRYSTSQFSASGDRVVYDGGRPAGLEFVLAHLDKEAVIRVQGSLGVQHTYNYAAAVAVGSVFGVELESATRALTKNELPPGRMKILRGIKDTLIVDDSYNSSPTACKWALQTFKELKGVKRKVAILGDMMELGQYSVREHEEVGKEVAEVADVLITIGVRSRKIAEAALEYGLSEKNIYQYDLIDRAQREIINLIKEGDVILVKASQSVRAEKIVEAIMFDTNRKAELVVRQEPEWKAN